MSVEQFAVAFVGYPQQALMSFGLPIPLGIDKVVSSRLTIEFYIREITRLWLDTQVPLWMLVGPICVMKQIVAAIIVSPLEVLAFSSGLTLSWGTPGGQRSRSVATKADRVHVGNALAFPSLSAAARILRIRDAIRDDDHIICDGQLQHELEDT